MNRDFVMQALKQFFDDEINSLSETMALDENQDLIDATNKLLIPLSDKRSKLSSFCVSSQNYTGMPEVKEVLVNLAKEKRTTIPGSWVRYYREIIESKKIYLSFNETSRLFQ